MSQSRLLNINYKLQLSFLFLPRHTKKCRHFLSIMFRILFVKKSKEKYSNRWTLIMFDMYEFTMSLTYTLMMTDEWWISNFLLKTNVQWVQRSSHFSSIDRLLSKSQMSSSDKWTRQISYHKLIIPVYAFEVLKEYILIYKFS